MSEKVDETLKKIAAGMKSGKSDSRAGGEPAQGATSLGDPNCSQCGGLGYVRMDVPLGHADFGKLQYCVCREKQINQQVRQRLFALSQLEELRHLGFENFNPRGRVGLWPLEANSLEQAFNLARQYAQTLKGWLLLQGDYGCGKTHLAAAIANFAVGVGVPTLFITVPDMLDSLRFAYQDPEASFEERFEEIQRAPLLVLDDFGMQNATPWAQEKLFQIINFRYINRLPLVVTTNVALEDIDARIRSRLEDSELVTVTRIQAPDYRRPTSDLAYDELASLDLLTDCTFASFDLRKEEGLPANEVKSLEQAFKTAQAYARKPEGWLLLTGPYGCGKTHLAAAIAHYRRDMGFPQMFVVVPDLLDYLRAAFSPNSTTSMDRRFERIRRAPFLVLDDLGTQSMTPWVREKLYQLFNFRYNAELPTVITTASHWDELDPRLISRVEDQQLCTLCVITAPSYRGVGRRGERGKRGRGKGN
ncbi:MAG: ATP-binding protein [Anaerolineales bacterium]|nr:ATP-binding protein [Anaerolineales bacterium]